MIYDIIIFIAALAVLIKASGFLVESASKLAKAAGISEFMIGFSIVAVGTSLPELVSSIAAAFYGNSGLVMGNIVGSNIANIALILAAGALIMPLAIQKRMFTREGMFLLFSSLLFYAFALTGRIKLWHGILMIVVYALYLAYIAQNEIFNGAFMRFLRDLITARAGKGIGRLKTAYKEYKNGRDGSGGHISVLFAAKQLMIISVSCFALYFSSKYLIPAAHNIALGLHVPDTIIGVTLLAVGTSLPELTVSIIAARKAKGDLLVGNILGSNIANILLIIGISSIISPLAVASGMIYFFMPAMLLITILLLGFIRANWAVRMIHGFVFLVLYAVFIALIIYLIKTGFLAGAALA